MSSEAIVFVVFDESRKKTNCSEAADLLLKRHPGWQIAGLSATGFAAGLYSWFPVVVSLDRHPTVREEMEDMARELVRTNAPADIVAQVRGSSARFELVWDLSADRDPVPETAEVVSEIAQAITELTGGIALNGGNRVFVLGTDNPFDQLFPAS